MTRQGGEACRPRPEKAEESFVASSERSFFLLSGTQIDGEGGVGIGKYDAEALLTTDAGGRKNNEIDPKAKVLPRSRIFSRTLNSTGFLMK